MKITVTYNLREYITASGIKDNSGYIDSFSKALKQLGYKVSCVEVSGKPDGVIDRLLYSDPSMIFNMARGTIGRTHKAFYPALYEQVNIPFTGPDSSLLYMLQDRFLARTIISARGIMQPGSVHISVDNRKIPGNIKFPVVLKPNDREREKGIKHENILYSGKQAEKRIDELLTNIPSLIAEEYIEGREFSIPILESYRGGILEILEYTNKADNMESSSEYSFKNLSANGDMVPAQLSDEQREKILSFINQINSQIKCPDLFRLDICMDREGELYLIEVNPTPSLRPNGFFMKAAIDRGLSFKDVVKFILRSAFRRYNIKKPKKAQTFPSLKASRPTSRELGITTGRFPSGKFNAITDIKGVKVGHVTYIEDDVDVPGIPEKTRVRTGVTAIIPGSGNMFNKRMVAGGFVLNGVGEMAGLTQVMEWGWLESPILLTNTMSVGRIHSGVIAWMHEHYPEMRDIHEVLLPVVGETDDSYLNDVRVRKVTAVDAKKAIQAAKSGFVPQGSVGAGTGMTTFDFAGGIGTSSRVLPEENGSYKVGVLVLSNFGNMRNLTIEGAVVGRELDKIFSKERRKHSYGSIIVVVATDAPLLSSQLNRVSKRAALGLGRVGSHAGYTSGEIIIAFSTGNRTLREEYGKKKHQTMKFITDSHLNPIYEAVIEATEEAVLNAVFCSGGMKGRGENQSPALPVDRVVDLLKS